MVVEERGNDVCKRLHDCLIDEAHQLMRLRLAIALALALVSYADQRREAVM